ncbi:MAG: N-acetylmuramoyl-L-alanine amidase [Candidatus Neomarinimicrobiota bacterium]
MVKARNLLLIIFLVCQTLLSAAPIRVLFRADLHQDKLKTLERGPGTYFSSIDLARILSCRYYVNPERQKIVLYLNNHRVKISAQSSFIMVDEQVYQLPTYTQAVGEDVYIPAETFFSILGKTVIPGLLYNSSRQLLDVDMINFNITGVTFEEKTNGTIIRLQTRAVFPEGNLSSFVHENGWFYITVANGLADSSTLVRSELGSSIRRILVDQLDESAQVAFQLRPKIEAHEVYQTQEPSEIVITLRTPVMDSMARLKDLRDRWYMDTVVLDAGHGGKDGGTIGRYGTKEKDINLDIVKRVGLLLEKNTTIKVVYTRDEDVFIPLLERPKIANANNGKLFVSVHANGAENRKVRGFETYFLSQGKTDDAIEVAARENEVIKLEEQENNFSVLSNEALIMATMAQSAFIKESEGLAAAIQNQLAKKISSQNRGVKQAEFYVMVGASMPNVLIETGFLSNAEEEKLLKKPSYRQKIAEAVYQAIVEFKNTRDTILAEGN